MSWGTVRFGAYNSGASAYRQSLASELNTRRAADYTKARTAIDRFKAAEKAHENGDIRTASLLYIRTIHHKRVAKPSMVKTAESRLEEYRKQGIEELSALVKSVGDDYTESKLEQGERFRDVFKAIRELEAKYRHVAKVRQEIASRRNELLRNPLVARTLYQPEASRLLEEALKMKELGQECCAYLVLEEAAQLRPSNAAKAAAKQLSTMRSDYALMTRVDECRNIRNCQVLYDKAIRFAENGSKTARETAHSYLEKIVDRAPDDSKVYLAARRLLANDGK